MSLQKSVKFSLCYKEIISLCATVWIDPEVWEILNMIFWIIPDHYDNHQQVKYIFLSIMRIVMCIEACLYIHAKVGTLLYFIFIQK